MVAAKDHVGSRASDQTVKDAVEDCARAEGRSAPAGEQAVEDVADRRARAGWGCPAHADEQVVEEAADNCARAGGHPDCDRTVGRPAPAGEQAVKDAADGLARARAPARGSCQQTRR